MVVPEVFSEPHAKKIDRFEMKSVSHNSRAQSYRIRQNVPGHTDEIWN
jgi:hypothetical protein